MQAVWIELPVKDIDRALAFYQAVFDFQPGEVVDDGTRRTTILNNMTMEGRPGLSLNQTANFEPSNGGVLIYLDVGEDLTAQLGRIDEAGGKVLTEKTSMGESGNYALFLDSEGNQLALYSYK